MPVTRSIGRDYAFRCWPSSTGAFPAVEITAESGPPGRYRRRMFSAADLVAFALASLAIIAIPGPSVLFVIGRALSLGRGTAIASVIGNALGVYAVAVFVEFGLGTLVQRSEVAVLVIKLVGAVYLVWLGIQAIRHRHELSTAMRMTAESTSKWR